MKKPLSLVEGTAPQPLTTSVYPLALDTWCQGLVCKFYTLAIIDSYSSHIAAYSIVAVMAYQFLLQYRPPLLEFYGISNTLEPLVHCLQLRPHLLRVRLTAYLE